MAIANELKREFNVSTIVFSRKNKEGKDEYFVTKEDIETALKPGRNIVFLETQNESFISGATSILAALNLKENPEDPEMEKVEVLLTTTRFNGAFEGDEVDNTHLSKLQFTFASSSKSYSEEDNNMFVKHYQKVYNITPSRRAVKGFDLTMDVVLRMATSEDLYMSVNSTPLTAYVENKFAYKKQLFGGYYNDAIYLVKYDDLNLVEVKQ